MAMKRCPDCGEYYSDTYRHCPFCEEEAALRGGAPRRKGGHRVAQKGPSLLSPLLTVAIILMACVLAYLLFGNAIAQKLGMSTGSDVTPAASSQVVSSAPPVSSGSQSAAASSAGTSQADPSGLPETLTLSKTDFTMNVGDSPVSLSVSGGSGTYSWTSSDDGIASVDSSGKVVAISSGTVTITASDGSGKGSCIVRIKGSGTPNAGGAGTGSLTLSASDVSIKVGESFVLSASGAQGSVTYTAENSAVASVSAAGKVTGVAAGRTNITVTADGKSTTCIVRVH